MQARIRGISHSCIALHPMSTSLVAPVSCPSIEIMPPHAPIVRNISVRPSNRWASVETQLRRRNARIATTLGTNSAPRYRPTMLTGSLQCPLRQGESRGGKHSRLPNLSLSLFAVSTSAHLRPCCLLLHCSARPYRTLARHQPSASFFPPIVPRGTGAPLRPPPHARTPERSTSGSNLLAGFERAARCRSRFGEKVYHLAGTLKRQSTYTWISPSKVDLPNLQLFPSPSVDPDCCCYRMWSCLCLASLGVEMSVGIRRSLRVSRSDPA